MTGTGRPGTVWALIVLTAIQGLGGIPAGIGLQIVFGLVGVAIIVLTLVRPMRRFFRVGGFKRLPNEA